MSNLIKEAIADARAVREMAVKQAESAIREAFSPKIDAMISQKLQAEADELDAEEELEEPEMEEESIEEVADSSDIGDSDNKEPSKEASEETTEDEEGPVDVKSDHDEAKESDLTEAEEPEEELDDVEVEDEDEDEVELESIIKELEDEVDEFEDEEDEEEIDIDIEDDEEEVEEAEDYEDEEVDDEEEIDIEIEDDDEEEVEEAEDYEDEEVEDEEEIDLESIMDEMSDEDDEEELEELRKENAALKAKLGEAMKVVKIQKNSLNETNILNAKLLFSNKVFRNYNLDDRSKIKVVENFDRAKSVREVKLIYSTLMENLGSGKKVSNVSKFAEGASKVISTPKKDKGTINENIIENSDVKNRVHKLMGYKNK